MSQFINELATIELSNEILQRLDIGSIYQNFNKSYGKLDDLKSFRTKHEGQNAVMRWWHNDKLDNAQLDSVEVQAEFSKTIGQLMVLSIMQSKKLSEQQTQLNEQQVKLKSQADGIAEHAGELQNQHRVLAEQSERLETLVHEYFELKGLTEDGAQKLITIAQEIKATKEGMLQEFAVRAKNLAVLCGDVATQMESVSSQANEQFRLISEQIQSSIQALQTETRQDLEIFSTKLAEQDAAYQEKLRLIDGGFNAQTIRVTEVENSLSTQNVGLTACAQQQKTYQLEQVLFEKKISDRLHRLGLIVACSSVITPIMLFGIARLMQLI